VWDRDYLKKCKNNHVYFFTTQEDKQDVKRVGKGECTAHMDGKRMNFTQEACE